MIRVTVRRIERVAKNQNDGDTSKAAEKSFHIESEELKRYSARVTRINKWASEDRERISKIVEARMEDVAKRDGLHLNQAADRTKACSTAFRDVSAKT